MARFEGPNSKHAFVVGNWLSRDASYLEHLTHVMEAIPRDNLTKSQAVELRDQLAQDGKHIDVHGFATVGP